MNTLASYDSTTAEDLFSIIALASGTMKYRPGVSGTIVRDACNATKFYLTDTPLADLTENEVNRAIGAIWFNKDGLQVLTKAHGLRLQWEGEQERRRKQAPISIELSHEDWLEVRNAISDLSDLYYRHDSRPLNPALHRLVLSIAGKTLK